MTEIEILKRIYPSVVTFASDWKKQAAEVDRLGLKEISLFLTGAAICERQEIYQILERAGVKKIPHVHARHDFLEKEFDYLTKRFKTRAFTIHFQYFKFFKKSKHLKRLFIESNRGSGGIKNFNPFKKIGGLCIDLSHITKFKIVSPNDYLMALAAAEKFRIGCNHVSAYNKKDRRAWHFVRNKKELDYLADIDKKYFSKYICLEIGNSIKQQLEFKKYIAKLLAKQWNKRS